MSVFAFHKVNTSTTYYLRSKMVIPRASHLKCIPLVKNWLRSKRLYEVLWFEKLILFVRLRSLLPSEFSILEKKSQTKKWSSVKIQREKWWKYCLQVNFMWKSSSTLFTFGEYKWNKVKYEIIFGRTIIFREITIFYRRM